MKEKSFFEDIYNKFSKSEQDIESITDLLELAIKENDKQVTSECEKNLNLLYSTMKCDCILLAKSIRCYCQIL